MEKLFIVDLMPFLYKGYFVFLRNPRLTSAGINTSALLGLANGLESILKKEDPDYMVLAMDPCGATFRHEFYPPYKAQREKMPEDIASNIPYAFELAEALKIPVVKMDGFEADDIMGTLAKKGREKGFEVYMATPDKDAAQLVEEGIRLYRPPRAGDEAQILDVKDVCEHWKISSPAQMIDYLALAGDSSDNIPGIKGVGEKTAVDLLSKYSSIEGIIENAKFIKGKLGEKVLLGAHDAKISKFLATIKTDVPIEPDWEAWRRVGVDKEKLAQVCAKFELNRLAKNFGLGIRQDALSLAEAPKEESSPTSQTQKPETIDTTPHEYKLISTENEARALLANLMKEPRIAFDTETAAREGHSSVEAHFCKLVGFSLCAKPGVAWYIEGALVDIFRPLFACKDKIFVGHNVKFDRSVLHRYGIGFGSTPRDTMLEHYCLDSSARHSMDVLAQKYLGYSPIPITKLIGEKERGKEQRSMEALKPEEVLDYAAEDADVTLRLDDAIRPLVKDAGILKALEESEEPLVKILIEMEREGVRIDVETLKDFSRELDRELLDLTIKIKSYADPGFNPDSPKQLSELLFNKLALVAAGAKKTATGQYSTDEKTLSKLIDAHPIIQNILDYRSAAKLKSTYADKLPQLIDEEGRVHTTFSQAFTETGRLSSSDPNLQNIPIRTERGKLIRKAFIARNKDSVIVSADYSQIELRLIAALSKDEAMLEAFRKGEDIHRDTASRVYGIMPALVSSEQRAKCKMVNFGIIYGISPFGLSQRLKIPRREAANLIDTYFSLYPKIREYMQSAISSAREKGYAETVLGRRRYIRDINSRNATARQAAERDAINTPIQGSAADLIKLAMVKIDRAMKERGFRAKMVLQIHDELLFDCPRDEAEALCELVKREMTSAYDFGVPLDVGIGYGENWLEAH